MEITEGLEVSLRGYAPLVDRSGQSSSTSLPGKALYLELVDLFFTYNYEDFPSLLRMTSLPAALDDGFLPKVLFFAVICLSARFCTLPSRADITLGTVAAHTYGMQRDYLIFTRHLW